MFVDEGKKILIVVSTGRCGTKRLKEILSDVLADKNITIEHQVSQSRWANVIGNLLYYIGGSESVKKLIYFNIIRRYATHNHFVITDPLTAMVIPKKILLRDNTFILHIERESASFGRSFYQFSRKKTPSFIAHNFIPFWQITLWPLENFIKGKRIQTKYAAIAKRKNAWFQKHYGTSNNYRHVMFEQLFQERLIREIISEIFNLKIDINPELLSVKSNKST